MYYMHIYVYTHVDTRINEEKNQYARFQKMTLEDKTNLRYTGDYSRKLMTDSELMTETYQKIKKAEMVGCLYDMIY